jgi:predicted ATPase/DNA-binding SARP family transcriptional activator
VIRFGVLGSLDVRVGDSAVDLGGPRQRSLLAALLLHAREPVSADALAQMLWGDEAPPSTANALQVNVSRLRGKLGAASERLETVSGGYRLRVEPGELDADVFEQAYERARSLPAADAAKVLREALDLWRGPALVDVRYEPWAQGEIRRLEELRAAAIEERVATELELGEHARLVGELGSLVAEFPLRERLRALQMLALYRAGRHADALAAFRTARETLDAELGLEPGPELRRLEHQILVHDPSLVATAPGVPPPPPTPTFGRDKDIGDVLAALDTARLLTLVGPGGVGKTRLAIEVARAAGGRFVSLASTADADRIPGVICDALAVARVPGESDLAALDRTLERSAGLLVLDNLEHLPGAAVAIAGLLERHADLTVLATSRRPIDIHAERQFPVAPLGVGGDSPAVALFSDRAQAGDPSFALTKENAAAVAAVCARLAGLPLAIELAAARLGVLGPAALAERLDDALAVLDHGPHDAAERHQTLRATLDWSYELLDEQERDAFSALGVFTGGCELDAAEAVTGSPLSVIEAVVAHSLVTIRDRRLILLEPVRQYAADRLAARPDAEAVRARHLAHLRALAEGADHQIWVQGRRAPGFAAVHRERDNFETAIEWAFASGRYVDALAVAGALGFYSELRRTDEQAFRWCARALEAAGPAAPARLRARALLAQLGMRFDDDAVERASAALALYRQLEDDTGIARALIVVARVLSSMGEYDASREAAEEALDRARRLGDRGVIGAALGEIALATPEIEKALPFARDAVAQLRAAGAIGRTVGVLSSLGMAALSEDAYDHAEQLERDALDAAHEIDDPYALTLVYGNMGLAALLGDRPDAARAAFRAEYQTAHRHGYVRFYFEALLGFAALAAADEQDRRAATLQAAAWASTDTVVYPSEVPIYERVEQRFIAAAQRRLDPESWEAAAAAGRAMSADAAMAFALADADASVLRSG